jgi:hypothetical protein
LDSAITNLTGSTIPANAIIDTDLPGCTFVNELTLNTIDCVVSKTVATLPPACLTNMTTRDCVLHHVAAFCSDIPEARFGLLDSMPSAVENCLYGIRYGPCVANPSGAACVSRQFEHVQFDSIKTNNRGHMGPLFGPITIGNDRVEEEFYIGILFLFSLLRSINKLIVYYLGVAKNEINSGIGLINLGMSTLRMSTYIECVSAAQRVGFFSKKAQAEYMEGCQALVRIATPVSFICLKLIKR